MSINISIVGLGWLGLPLALRLKELDYTVVGTVTSSEKLLRLVASPFAVKVIKISTDQIIGDWKSITEDANYIFINIPPSNNSNGDHGYIRQIKQIIKRTNREKKIIFISSTSVYGDQAGLVDETSTCKPTKKGGQIVFAAENLLREHFQENLTIIRFGGLIGPERHPGKFIKAGQHISNPDWPVNLIHLADCIQIIEKTIQQNSSGELLNGCCDIHPTKREMYNAAALDLGIEPPLFEQQTQVNPKIVANSKAKNLLNLTYLYANPIQMFER